MTRWLIVVIGLILGAAADAASFGRTLTNTGLTMRAAEDYEAEKTEREQLQRLRELDLRRRQLELQRLRYQEYQELQADRIRQQNEDLLRERQQLEAQLANERRERQRLDEERQQAAERQWRQEVADFLRDHPHYEKDPMLFGAFDAAVKELGNRPENADRSGRWFLETAHELVEARFRPPATKPPTTPTKKPVIM